MILELHNLIKSFFFFLKYDSSQAFLHFSQNFSLYRIDTRSNRGRWVTNDQLWVELLSPGGDRSTPNPRDPIGERSSKKKKKKKDPSPGFELNIIYASRNSNERYNKRGEFCPDGYVPRTASPAVRGCVGFQVWTFAESMNCCCPRGNMKHWCFWPPHNQDLIERWCWWGEKGVGVSVPFCPFWEQDTVASI
jgi:hypothetical protein